jgi:hypothetical protein
MILVDDLVRSVTESDYDRSYHAWRDHMSSFDWCLDTGRFGSVGEPGVSDLDCIALVRDGSHAAALDSHSTWLARQPGAWQFLFAHPPYIVTEAARDIAPILHTLHNLRWDRGTGPKMSAVSPEAGHFAHLVYALVIGPECARKIEKHGSLSLRLMLLLLKSLHVSEGYWADALADDTASIAPVARSRQLRCAVLAHAIPTAQLRENLKAEIRASIVRLSGLLDAYGERLSAVSPDTAQQSSSAPLSRLTRTYGRVFAGSRTMIGPLEDTITLHRSVFAVAFGLASPATPLGAAAAAFWEATLRMRAIRTSENLLEDCFPRPFYYQPGLDDADLDDQEFNCLAMPTAVPSRTLAAGRISTGVAGHLVYGPYVRILKESRYHAEVTYATESCSLERAGAFDISVCRIDAHGNQDRFQTLAFADLPPTGRAPGMARIDFDTTGHGGALLETRVFADAGAQLHVFRIRIRRAQSESRPLLEAVQKGEMEMIDA